MTVHSYFEMTIRTDKFEYSINLKISYLKNII